jgi:hypothetical protein
MHANEVIAAITSPLLSHSKHHTDEHFIHDLNKSFVLYTCKSVPCHSVFFCSVICWNSMPDNCRNVFNTNFSNFKICVLNILFDVYRN